MRVRCRVLCEHLVPQPGRASVLTEHPTHCSLNLLQPLSLDNGAGSAGNMDRLKILCFAGTYGLALLAELSRLVVRSPFRWYLTVALTALGWLVRTVFLTNLPLKDPLILPVTTP